MILFPVTVAFFWRSPLILWTYLSGASFLLLFASLLIDNRLRHSGHFFLWFLICLWLAHYFPGAATSRTMRPFQVSSCQKLFVAFFLVIQVLNSVFASIAGCHYPYSCSRDVAAYLRQHQLNDLPIVGYPDYAAMPVSGYLNVRIYYPDTQRWGSFVIENNIRRTDWNTDQILDSVREFAAQGHQDFLLLLNGPLAVVRDNRLYEPESIGNLHEEASFYPSIQWNESYWVYRYKAASPPIP